MTPFKPEAIQAIEACRTHAQELYDAAKIVRNKDLPNIAYHLATLALEELGKAQLVGMRSFAKEDAGSWYDKQLDDHIKKLFWALWGHVLNKRPDRKEIEELRGTATIIHNNRLRGLYVEPSATTFVAPKEAVTDEMLAPLMSLVEAHLALQPSLVGVVYEQADLEMLSWFSHAVDDPEKRRFIFSKGSFDKMEAVDSKEWLIWIREEMEKSAADAMAALQKELAREFVQGEEGQQPKWELKIRLYSQSHSIRPKPLNQWNEKVTWLKLYPVDGKKDRLDAILKIPKFIAMQAIYHVGYGYSNLLLAALNIASGGLFWWHEPKNLSTFYESLIDVETKMGGKIGRSPELKLGWPHAVLDGAILDQVIGVFAMMPQPCDPPQESEPLMHYLAGVGLLAKTDVFLQFEGQSYGAFQGAANAILQHYQQDLGPDFPRDIPALLDLLNVDDNFKKKHADLIARYTAHTITQGAITLTEVAEMKRICDGLFIQALNQRLHSRANQEKNKTSADG